MLYQKDIQDEIDEAIKSVGIPSQFREDASQEGWVAALENRNIERALRYWWDTEEGFYQNVNIPGNL